MSRRPLRLLFVALLAASVGLAAEATAFASTSNEHSAAVAAKKKKKKPSVKLADSSLGKILVTPKGLTLYAFDPDGTDTSVSNCTDACSSIWPAAIAKKAVAGKGLDKSKLTLGVGGQLAYGGHLLYRFASDAAPGETKGQGVADVWHVVGADGNPIT